MLFHADGANIVTREGVAYQLAVLDRLRAIPDANAHCQVYGSAPCPAGVAEFVCFVLGVPLGSDAPRVCPVQGITAFWFHNTSIFDANVHSDYDVHKTLAIDIFPGEEEEYNIADVVGYAEFQYVNETKLLVAGTSYASALPLPGPAEWLEDAIIVALEQLNDEWKSDPSIIYRVELVTARSFEEETKRAITTDLPLTPFVVIMMSIFTALVFYERNWVTSRTAVGLGSVFCVVLSLMSGYGLMFLLGVPFTNLQLALLFIIFGIGLDDSFVLYASYIRTNAALSAVERIRETMTDVAISIFMTTATTEMSFLLGCLSPLPAIRWLSVRCSCCVFS